MIKLAVCGAAGRMGQHILAHAVKDKESFQVVGAVEYKGHPLTGTKLRDINPEISLDVQITDSLKQVINAADVVIDFTTPESSLSNAQTCHAAGKVIVIGTTGFTPDQLDEIIKYTGKIAIVLAPNMSVGVNLLFKLADIVASVLDDDYDCEIVELHHRFKKDSPSGTAARLAEIIAKARAVSLEDKGVYGRKGIVGERGKGDIGVHAVRLGNVVGEHTVSFANLGERIELTHKAQSRETFALGSLRAARFAVKASPGMYDMQDVLHLR
ncbi:MAG: 4-hydroxy-tetrahydrodipicolinate reductase [Candidatus Auribacter fodinae]|jgi:4-hydroxy-tetrahydrodipicolinate reductase|uniref:4-hydroxy-tetrahydrodipicolinate reductase n=1 Tax=Candidatus Auribacter fodinae TaxID=2093366 RepID=A0A3A4R442_9BACT|nr:MAG: 4-hydroxy-tetrahydrodipicolinate reductase [Candidatus Auribacter fodinae]